MTWQVASFSILALTLIGGAFWFERTRPPSQVVALVAALAALSVAGRVAFSPIPNVVPSTDIALIAGYALGGPPGFAVGALTGLVSNFWLGQGPWTPWQMAGWGMAGVLGAILARASRTEVGRLRLALVCAFAGFAYGALLDFSLMVTYGGEQSLDRFLAISARGLPFNVAHAVGNFTFAMVVGPALIRMLSRYRARFEFAWPGRAATAACVALALVAAALPAGGGPDADAAASGPSGAVAWLRGAQNPDGGFGTAPGEESSPQMTGWAVLGIEAAGVSPFDVSKGGKDPIDYLRSTASGISTTGDIERTILVLEAAGVNPRRFGGRDLVARLDARRGGDGSFGSQVNGTSFAILALRAAGSTAGNGRSAAWLRRVQNADGGWGFAPGASSDADSTGAALQALAVAGGSGKAISRGVSWLRGAQSGGGGFNLQGGPVNSQSTAWAVQGLVAAGVSPDRVRAGGRSGLDYIAANQAGDGHYRYSRQYDQTPVWVTGQALQAAERRALPLPVTRAASGGGGTGAGAGPGAGGGGVSSGTGAPAPPARLGGPRKKPKASRDTTGTIEPEAEQPPEAETAPELERVSDEAPADDGDGGGIDLGIAAALAVLAAVVAGGAFLLRRQGSAPG